MKTLILDTSTQFLFVNFMDNDQIIYQKIKTGKNNHSDNLLKVIEEGLDFCKLEVKDFNRLIVGIGPGAYTGLRVSLTVAKMFSWTLNIPLFTISSLDCVASAYFDKNGIYAIKMKAKVGYVLGKIIEVKKGQITTLEMEKMYSEEEFNQLIHRYPNCELIDEDKYQFNALLIKDTIITKVDDVYLLEPNYLRGEM